MVQSETTGQKEIMIPKLDALLCQRYLMIFADRHLPVEECSMGRGFECGDGWFDILYALCETIQFSVDHHGVRQVVATQVKEKFGTLRFRICGGNEETKGMIRMAETMSCRVRELCGKPGKTSQNPLMTRCLENAGQP